MARFLFGEFGIDHQIKTHQLILMHTNGGKHSGEMALHCLGELIENARHFANFNVHQKVTCHIIVYVNVIVYNTVDR